MKPTSKPSPEQLELDMQIDMLVDNELPEPDRKALLEKCEKQSTGWRKVAIRFLERQTEHKTVRDLIAGKTQENAYDAPPIYAFKLPFGLEMRSIAAVLLIAVGAGSLGLYYGQRSGDTMVARQGASEHNVAGADLSGGSGLSLASDRHGVHFDNSPLATDNSSSLDALLNGQNVSSGTNGPRNVIIVPQDRNRALVVPVSVDRAQVIY